MGQKAFTENTLFYGDNLKILRDYLADESVDLIYLDPPFNSDRNYNVLFKDESGRESEAQITAFDDTWHWSERAYEDLRQAAPENVCELLETYVKILGRNEMTAYLVMMAARLIELHRILKPTGSLYLHCDPTASHYLKIILDAIFSPQNFRNEIVWQRTNAHNMKTKGYVRTNDCILFFSKSSDFMFNEQHTEYGEEQLKRFKYDENGKLYKAENLTFSTINPNRQFEWRGTKPPAHRSWGASLEQLEQWYQEGRILLKKDGKPRLDGLKIYLDETKGKPITTNWTDIERVTNTSSERLGYPTQKPLTLLERILQVSSNEGDIVLDPFCGCGTAIHAAQKLRRTWLGIDITHLAIALIKNRLKDAFDIEKDRGYAIIGEPEDLAGARHLAEDVGRYQFQWWAVSLVAARPYGGKADGKEGKKGADSGIDGIIAFHDDPRAHAKRVIVQVKSGKVSVKDIRDLRGTLDREPDAEIGVFITLQEPTKPMLLEAESCGFYHSANWNKDFPKLQIVTIEQLLSGVTVQMPPTAATYKKAQREAEQAEQGALL